MAADVKREVKLEDGTTIKPEPDDEMDLSDVEDEDTGELHFPRSDLPPSWLIRIPKDLWAGLDRLNDNDEIQVGELWEWKDEKSGKMTTRWKIGSSVPGFDLIAKEYDLQSATNTNATNFTKNTFVFSEKDIKGYQRGQRRDVKQEQAGFKKTEGGRVEKKQYRGPRTIPKHTSFVSTPQGEIHCSPRENDEWHALQSRKEAYARAHNPTLARFKFDVKEMQKSDEASGKDEFLRLGEPVRKVRKTENKYQRIDEKSLMGMLSAAFQEHRFWPIKALKERVKQPEAYLREVLNKIAILIRTGTYANTWTLKAGVSNAVALSGAALEDYEREILKTAKPEDVAPDVVGDSDISDDDDMEEVLLD